MIDMIVHMIGLYTRLLTYARLHHWISVIQTNRDQFQKLLKFFLEYMPKELVPSAC